MIVSNSALDKFSLKSRSSINISTKMFVSDIPLNTFLPFDIASNNLIFAFLYSQI